VTTKPDGSSVPERITINELKERQEKGEPVLIADVRTERSHAADELQARDAVRLPPDDAVRRARELGLDHHATLVLYCA
jgi:rhodanese-related sulfurtransferase